MTPLHTELREWARELKRAGVAVPKEHEGSVTIDGEEVWFRGGRTALERSHALAHALREAGHDCQVVEAPGGFIAGGVMVHGHLIRFEDPSPPRLRVYLHTPKASNLNTYEDVLKRRRIKGFRTWRGVVIVTGGPNDELPAHSEAKRFGGHGNRLSFETLDAFRDWAVAAIETSTKDDKTRAVTPSQVEVCSEPLQPGEGPGAL